MPRPTYSCSIKLRTMQLREAEGPAFRDAKGIASAFHDIATLDREAMFVITLSQKHRQIDRHLVSLGTLTASLVHPREVFRPAIYDGAAAIALVHNHPSGDPTPSVQDKEMTCKLKEAADLLGIRLLDHIIVGRDGFVSFLDEGLL